MQQSTSSLTLRNPWVLIAAFLILLGPFALDFHMHYPDEIYYRDAAVKMLQTEDYLTTYLGSGELRFKKPILTYWAVLAGFKLVGVNAFGSRIFFLLAGAATVGITYLLGKVLFRDQKIASLSAWIMAANPILLLSSARSIPDILLVMTMGLAALGFAGLLRDGVRAPKKYLWLMYLGLGLAFEVKGLPALALGGLGILFLRFNPWQSVSWKTLIYLPAVFYGGGIALFWFAAMWILHGPQFLEGFLDDQVGIRVTSRLWLILSNGALAVLLLLGMLLPWIALLRTGKEVWKKAWKENPQFFAFALLWGLAILGMGALTSKFYERYLLPVAPILSVYLAWMLTKGEIFQRIKAVKIALGVMFIFLLILFGANVWVLFGEKTQWWSWFTVGIGLILLASFGWVGAHRSQHGPLLISFSFFLVFFLLSGITRIISLPHQGEQAKVKLKDRALDAPIGFVGNLHVGSKIRMSLGPGYQVVDLPKEKWKELSPSYSYLIVEDKLLSDGDTVLYQLETLSREWKSKAIPRVFLAYPHASLGASLPENVTTYFFLEKKSTAQAARDYLQ